MKEVFFACQQLFYVDHVALLTAYWLFRISLNRAFITYTGFNEVLPPPLILIIVSFLGETGGTFDKLSVGIGVWNLRVSTIIIMVVFKQLSW